MRGKLKLVNRGEMHLLPKYTHNPVNPSRKLPRNPHKFGVPVSRQRTIDTRTIFSVDADRSGVVPSCGMS